MLRRFLAVAMILSSTATFAIAADNFEPIKGMEPVASSPYDWTGLYIGAVGGWSSASSRTDIPGYAPENIVDIELNGLVGGGYLGFNVQNGDIVYGLEADILWAHIEGEESTDVAGENYHLDENWRASLRGRIGRAFNDTLVYATAGVAWVNLDQRYSGGFFPPTPVETRTLHGWTAGLGVEKAFVNGFVGKLEYLYADYGEERFECNSCGPSFNDYQSHTFQVGLAYKF